jgi:hypothetical protein
MPSRQHSRTRLVLYTTAAVAGAVVIAYLILPYALALWLQSMLTGQGFSDVRIHLGYPGLQQLVVHQLDLTSRRGGRTFQFSARTLQLEYDIAGLLTGRLKRLHVPEATLRVTAAVPMDQTQAVRPPAPVAIPMPGEWIAVFPLQELDVERVAIEWREDDQSPFVGTVRGTARRDTDHLQTRWTLAQENRPRYEFALDLAADGALKAALYRSVAPQAPLWRAAVSVTPDTRDTVAIHGSIEAQLKPLMPLLAPWLALPPSVTGLDGQLKATWHGIMPGTLPATGANILHGSHFTGRVLLDASVARVASMLQDGRLHLDANVESHDTTLHWRVRQPLRLSAYLNPGILAFSGNAAAPFVRTPKPLRIRAPHGLNGELAIDPSEIRITVAPATPIAIEQLQAPAAVIPALTATLMNAARVSYRPASAQWETGLVALAVKAPVIQPHYAEIGTLDDLTVSVTLGAGPLNRLPPLHVDTLAITLLGGRLQADGIHYDGKHDSRFAIDIAHLDLARVVALEQQQGIEASGLLDGQLPITLTPRALTITDGRLHAQPPGGVIRYQGTDRVREMAATNPNLKLVLNALGNYHYDKLDVGVDYAEGGELVLRLGLTGRNPDWNAGQPIHLNISINENIPILLRSLQIADDISVEVEKRMKERSRPTP